MALQPKPKIAAPAIKRKAAPKPLIAELVPEPPKKVKTPLEAAREYLLGRGQGAYSSIASGVFITENGMIAANGYGEGYGACHAYLCYTGSGYVSDKRGAFNLAPLHVNITPGKAPRRIKTQKEKDDAFIKWVCQESPAAPFIVNKDNDDEICNYGQIIKSREAGRALTMWICKTIRYVVEDTFRVPIWYEMVQGGLDPLMAYFACSCMSGDWKISGNTTHCTTFANPKSAQSLVRSFRIAREGFKPCKEYRDTGNDSYVFGDRNGEYGGGDFFKIETRQDKVPDGWGGYSYKVVGGSHEDIINYFKGLCEAAKNGKEGKQVAKER